jgi:hypothetical protein
MWHTWEKKENYNVLVEKPDGKRPLGGWGRRWEEGVRIDHREIGWGDILDSVGPG